MDMNKRIDTDYRPIPDASIRATEIPKKSAISEADGGFFINFKKGVFVKKRYVYAYRNDNIN